MLPDSQHALKITVFASASPATPAAYMEAASSLGDCLARSGLICVNGGGAKGCMGALNDAVRAAGGRAHGVIHRQWIGEEAATGMEQMDVVDGTDLSERKRKLLEAADCLVALPGGVGTLDELFMAIAGVATHLSTLPIVLINTAGYYDGVLLQLRRAEEEGLLRVPYSQLVAVVRTPVEAVDWCVAQVASRHTLRVDGLASSAHCQQVVAALQAVPAVESAVADHTSKLVNVVGKVPVAALLAGCEAAGRPASWVGASRHSPRAPPAAWTPYGSAGRTWSIYYASLLTTTSYGRGLVHGFAVALAAGGLLRLAAAAKASR